MFASRCVFRSIALVFVIALPLAGRGQTVPTSGTVYLQPAWRPVSGTLNSPTTVTSYSATAATAAGGSTAVLSNGWPYYSDSPLYRTASTSTFSPSATMTASPAPWDATARPAVVPDQMIQPMVSTPGGLVPGAPAQPVASQSTIPPAPSQPSGPQAVISSVPATPSPPAAIPMAQPVSTPAPLNPQPFVDSSVFVPGGQSWIDIDITAYTSRFQAAPEADKSIREWILRKTDPSSWMGGEVASLVVTPDRVRIYHTPAVQQQVRDLLGRFLYYTPGEFQTRVQIVNVRNPKWRGEAGSALQPVGSSGKVWVGAIDDVAAISSAISARDAGTMLANPDVVVFNGQKLHVGWSPTSGREPDPKRTGRPTEEGVIVDVSPLIDSDAASIEVDLAAAVRRDVPQSQSFFRSTNNSSANPPVEEGSLHELVRVQPGQAIVASLGQVTSFDNNKGLLGRNKSAEIVLIVACRPSPNNTLNGRPIVVASAVQPKRSTSARPFDTPGASAPEKEKPRRLPKPFVVPPELTAPVD